MATLLSRLLDRYNPEITVTRNQVSGRENETTLTGSIRVIDPSLLGFGGSGVASVTVTPGRFGTLSIGTDTNPNADIFQSTYSYTPFQSLRHDQQYTEIFTVTATDGVGRTVSSNFSLTITGSNDAPVLQALSQQAVAVTEALGDSATPVPTISGTLSVSDMDIGDTLTASVIGSPVVLRSSGAAVPLAIATELASAITLGGPITATGGTQTIEYTFNPEGETIDLNFLRQDETLTVTYTVQVSDGSGAGNNTSTSQPVTFTFRGVNDSPVANPDTLEATEDTPVTYTAAQLLSNDTDTDGDTLTLASVTAGIGGAVVLNADGTVTFSPDANFNGAASFSYVAIDDQAANNRSNSATVMVNVAPVNDAPEILTADNTGQVSEDMPNLNGRSVAIDYRFGDINTLFSQSPRQDGVIRDEPEFRYSNPSILIDIDSGLITINFDGPGTFSTAAFNGLRVFDPNDNLPAFVNVRIASSSEFAFDASRIIFDNDNIFLNFSAIQSAPTPRSVLQIAFDSPNAQLTDSGDITFDDADLTDAHTVQVNAEVTNPIGGSLIASVVTAATGSGTGLIRWTYSVENEDIQYLSEEQTEFESFVIAVNDGNGAITNQTVTVGVTGTNDAPLAVDDTLATTEDTPVTYTAAQLLGNDTDVDADDTLSIASVTSGIGGTVGLNTDGTVTFTPNANFNGVASFSYMASDGRMIKSLSNSAVVTVNVAPVNDAPEILSADSEGQIVLSNLNGRTVAIDYRYGDINTLFAPNPRQDGVIREETEFRVANPGFNVDIDSGLITINGFPRTERFDSVAFNGLRVFDPSNNLPSFASLRIVNSNEFAFDASRLSFDNDSLFLNFSGLQFTTNSVLQLAFGSLLTDSGIITFDDVELSDTHTVQVIPNAANVIGGSLVATITDTAAGPGTGTVKWTYSVNSENIQSLAQGQAGIESFIVAIDDGNGGVSSQNVTVELMGVAS